MLPVVDYEELASTVAVRHRPAGACIIRLMSYGGADVLDIYDVLPLSTFVLPFGSEESVIQVFRQNDWGLFVA